MTFFDNSNSISFDELYTDKGTNVPRFSPSSITIGINGTIFIGDLRHGIRVFHSNGAYRGLWTAIGLLAPTALAMGWYCGLSCMDIVGVLRKDKTLGAWPPGLANICANYTATEILYAGDTDEIFMFTMNGLCIKSVSLPRIVKKNQISSLAIDPSGNIYLLRKGGHTAWIYTLSPSGQLIGKRCMHVGRSILGFAAKPSGGLMYLLDGHTERLHRISPEELANTTWRRETRTFDHGLGLDLAVGMDDRVYTLDLKERHLYLRTWSADLALQNSWRFPASVLNAKLAVGPQGRVCLIDKSSGRIFLLQLP